jgi:hypothetical protein
MKLKKTVAAAATRAGAALVPKVKPVDAMGGLRPLQLGIGLLADGLRTYRTAMAL